MASAQEPGSIQPWHAAYPPPKNAQPASLTREELLQMIKAADSVAKRDFVLVDLRRTDLVVSFFFYCPFAVTDQDRHDAACRQRWRTFDP